MKIEVSETKNTISDDGATVVIKASGDESYTLVIGAEQGPQGPQGETGPQGPQGDPAPIGGDPTYARKDANLSDLVDIPTARTNLGVSATGADGAYLQKLSNLSDIADAAVARANLGLGSVAVQNSDNVNFTGGAIDGTTIGANTPSTGGFSALNLSQAISDTKLISAGGSYNSASTMSGIIDLSPAINMGSAGSHSIYRFVPVLQPSIDQGTVTVFNNNVQLANSANNVSTLIGQSIPINLLSTFSGTVSTFRAFSVGAPVVSGGSLGTSYGIYTVAHGVPTNACGIAIGALTASGKNTHLLLGTNTIPTGNWGIYNSSTNSNYFAGSLGINTTSPTISSGTAGLHVAANVAGSANIRSSGPTTDNNWGGGIELMSNNGTTVNSKIVSSVNGMMFYFGGSERARIASTGNFGIGTSTTTYPLTVNGAAGASSFIPTGSTVATNGLYLPTTNTPAISANSLDVARYIAETSAANYLTLTSRAAGNGPTLFSNGNDANTDIVLIAKGSGTVRIATGGVSGTSFTTQAYFTHTASATNRLTITGGATGTGPSLGVNGTVDTNADLNLNPLGTGAIKLNGPFNANNALRTDANKNVVVANAALSTGATDGFLYIPSCAGAPTNTPTTYSGRTPIAFDTTNNRLYIYNGAWKMAAFV